MLIFLILGSSLRGLEGEAMQHYAQHLAFGWLSPPGDKENTQQLASMWILGLTTPQFLSVVG